MTRTLSERTGVTGFDFLVGAWDIHNRRKNGQGVREEFSATNSVSNHVDGLVQVDYYHAPNFPGRGHVQAVTIRAFDRETEEWSIVWLSNYAPPDFRPVVGRFEGAEGRFYQVIETAQGAPLHVEFVWDGITDDSARWQQSFSLDGGKTWDLNWIMEFSRRR
jgi:hypothetical protein